MQAVNKPLLEKGESERGEEKRMSIVLSLGLELGYIIAIPIIIFAFIGRYADRAFNTSPLFLLTGISLALAISTWLIYRKITKLS